MARRFAMLYAPLRIEALGVLGNELLQPGQLLVTELLAAHDGGNAVNLAVSGDCGATWEHLGKKTEPQLGPLGDKLCIANANVIEYAENCLMIAYRAHSLNTAEKFYTSIRYQLSEDGGKTFPYDVELEVPVRTPADGLYKIEVLREGTAAVAYVNSEAALSFRMYDIPTGHRGLFSLGTATCSDIALYTDKH